MNMDVQEYLPFLIPLLLLQLVLMVTALVMIIRQEHFKYLNKVVWIIIVLLLNIIGPILYFVLERR
ncbi:PLDc N-terminal domain-containing protein [Salinicoccus sp. RF5]|uniref:PLDc N-terminal domain-containing protein n=1 Tax=Salinicoccus sp. RF5 TaxID=2748874 RepID=UPI001E494372|nr:PLDc N-terminal domain-containing protein [Salinicoccus sp. RF5]MCC4722999.1 PLDc N-terminal domain-containing protein [Salinicoccus sp. RF5]